jgi:hypothetical protein
MIDRERVRRQEEIARFSSARQNFKRQNSENLNSKLKPSRPKMGDESVSTVGCTSVCKILIRVDDGYGYAIRAWISDSRIQI